MVHLRVCASLAVAIAIAGLGVVTVEGQAPVNAKSPAATKWTAPRTPDGRPDLQGNWSNNSVTPLERPKAWAGKTVLNDAELEQLRKLTAEVTEEGGDAQFGDSIIENALAGVEESRLQRLRHGQLQPLLAGRARGGGSPDVTHHRPARWPIAARDGSGA